jgi:HlyD family secretion protein
MIKNTLLHFILFGILLSVYGCREDEGSMDASGVFESTEIVVSSEVNGVIESFPSEEGDLLSTGDVVVEVDVTDMEIQTDQIDATIEAIGDKQFNAGPQVAILEQQLSAADANLEVLGAQLDVLLKEEQRINDLFAAKAATSKQVDDIEGQLKILREKIKAAESGKEVIKAQIQSARDQVSIQNRGITSERKPLEKQKSLILNQMDKAEVKARLDGTLLSKYAYQGEFVNIGKPLFRMADLSTMFLRAYISGNQLSEVKVGQQVKVYIDEDQDTYKEYDGTISWISDKAEFTPKSIQTKDERANLVYAMKVKVANDGFIKIGMYGEVRWQQHNDE